MDQRAESVATERNSSHNAFALYGAALRNRPFGAGFGLVIEYLTFAAGLFLALLLFITRVPLRVVDRALGLGLRQRFVDLLARISPG